MIKKDEIRSDSSYDVNKSYASIASGAIASARSDSVEEDVKEKQRVKWNDANKEFLSHIKPILEQTQVKEGAVKSSSTSEQESVQEPKV